MAVINADSICVLGIKRALIDRHGELRFARSFSSHADQMVAVAADGQIAGFLRTDSQPPYVVFEMDGAVHPAYRGQGIGSALLQWAAARAQAQLTRSPAGAQVVMQTTIFAHDRCAAALLTRNGYAPVRAWIHLEIDLTAPPPASTWTHGIRVRPMDPQRDWPAVDAELAQAFEDHWGHILSAGAKEAGQTEQAEPENRALGNDDPAPNDTNGDDPYFNSRAFCFVATDGPNVVGSCLGNAQSIEWPHSGKVGSLSVLPAYRRRGIARCLMLHAFGEFYQQGVRRVITDTDADSLTGANFLYRQLGMHIYRREHTYERESRPGVDLRVLSATDLAQ